MFEIKRIDRRQRAADEPLGSKPKFWFYQESEQFLFKADERGTGEDWAEKIACQLCERLGLPHVHYELAAEYDGDTYIWPGVVCATCAPGPPDLVLGNELLFVRDPDYPRDEDRKYKVREHTVAAVADAVCVLHPPSDEWMQGAPQAVETALDVFAGYVMLDAWIANQDRHHENWAALSGDLLRLAPTFDHGASLARNLKDDERHARLESKDQNYQVAAYARRARSAFYSGVAAARSLGTAEAFWEFAGLVKPAARAWLDRLEATDRAALAAIIDEIPGERMTETTRSFTLELLVANRTHLLQESVRL